MRGDGVAQVRQLGVIAGVVPGDDRADGIATVIQQDSRFSQARYSKRGDGSGRAGRKGVGHGSLNGCEQGIGVEFGT